MTEPQVSFVIPCYNYARYLPDCLAGIFAQEGDVDFEVIIADDASTDETPAILAQITDRRVRVVRNETNLGHIATVERLIGLARGRLIARIDPDDRYRTNFLQLTVPIFDRHPDVGLVYGDAALIDDAGHITNACPVPRHDGRSFRGNELVSLLERNYITAPTVIARREGWLAALPVPPHQVCDDWYYTVSIARRWNFFYLPVVLADYRVHGANHHTRVARDGSEERSVRWLLDHVFATPERDPDLERAKQRARGRIYAAQAIDAAEKYFWFGNYSDARRCYLDAARSDARQMLRPARLRHAFATLIGQAPYETMKRMALRRRPGA